MCCISRNCGLPQYAVDMLSQIHESHAVIKLDGIGATLFVITRGLDNYTNCGVVTVLTAIALLIASLHWNLFPGPRETITVWVGRTIQCCTQTATSTFHPANDQSGTSMT